MCEVVTWYILPQRLQDQKSYFTASVLYSLFHTAIPFTCPQHASEVASMHIAMYTCILARRTILPVPITVVYFLSRNTVQAGS